MIFFICIGKNRISGNGVKLIVFKKWERLVNVDLCILFGICFRG